MPEINVLQLSTRDVKGGAARAAYRLHQGIRSVSQHASSMFVLHKYSSDSSVTAFQPASQLFARIRGVLLRRYIASAHSRYNVVPQVDYDLFSDSRSEFRGQMEKQLPSCDVVNLHWVAKFIDYQTFFPAISRRHPIVWTLHDMNAFTGGCHYTRDCGRFYESCGKCPQLKSHAGHDLSRKNWLRKRVAFDAIPPGRFHIVTPSQWMAAKASQSSLMKDFPVHVIPNGVNVHDFAPRDKTLARDILGVPQRRKVILFVAGSIKDVRKGLRFLIEALSDVDGEELYVLTVGKADLQLKSSVPCRHLGLIHHDRFLSMIYSAADLFIIPSLQDNLPNTVMESIACGTPVVGFNIGGIPDMVRPGLTGEVVPPRDTNGLRAAILGLLNHPEKLKEMTEHCRRIVLEEYTLERQALRYMGLYKALYRSTEEENTI